MIAVLHVVNFVCFFIFERLHNLDFSFPELLNEIFVPDTEKNELTVSDFYEKYQHGFID